MAKVKFKRSFFIEGYRFPAGVEEVPDKFLDRLPSDAEVVGAAPKPEPKPEAAPKASEGEGAGFTAKLYTACPKVFRNQDKTKEVERREIVALALKEFEAEGNELDVWNEITETERRGKIQAAAAKFFGEDTAVD